MRVASRLINNRASLHSPSSGQDGNNPGEARPISRKISVHMESSGVGCSRMTWTQRSSRVDRVEGEKAVIMAGREERVKGREGKRGKVKQE
jgi:hypothetical protein